VTVSAIVAAAENDVIGDAGTLPWHLPDDLRWFKQKTLGHVVVAGRLTNDSIVRRLGGPLPGRVTVVVSRSQVLAPPPGVHHTASPREALDLAVRLTAELGRDETFVIGGAQIYAACLPETDRVYLTRVHQNVRGDAALPGGWFARFGQLGDADAGDGFTRFVLERR
jgi:dihydrofolate reductase